MKSPRGELRVEVVYALPDAAQAVQVSLREGATVADAVAASGLPAAGGRFGIFGRRVEAQARLMAGDRVEIYRPLPVDPKEARRRRARKR